MSRIFLYLAALIALGGLAGWHHIAAGELAKAEAREAAARKILIQWQKAAASAAPADDALREAIKAANEGR